MDIEEVFQTAKEIMLEDGEGRTIIGSEIVPDKPS